MKITALLLSAAIALPLTPLVAQVTPGGQRAEKDCEAQYRTSTHGSKRSPAGQDAFVKQCLDKANLNTDPRAEKSCTAEYRGARSAKKTTLSQTAYVDQCMHK